MRIVYLTSVDATDDMAPSVHVRGTCRSMTELGHSVILIRASVRNRRKLDVTWLEKEVIVPFGAFRGGWKIFQLVAAIKLIKIIKECRPDVLYVRSSPSVIFSRLFEHFEIPVAYELNGTEILNHSLFPMMISSCDLVFTDSQTMTERFVDALPGQRHKVREHDTFVTDTHSFFSRDKDECCAELGIDGKKFRIIHVSSFQDWHDFETIISAFEQVSVSAKVAVELVLVGHGPQFGSIRERASQSPAGSTIRMVGRVAHQELNTWIGASDLALDVLSEQKLRSGKNLGAYKLYEYAACCRPTITAISSEFVPPLWAAKAFGLVPPGNVGRLAREINSVLERPDYWSGRAAYAYDYVRSYKTWKSATATTLRHLSTYLEDAV